MDQDRLNEPTPEEYFELTGVHYPKVPVCRRPEYEIAFEQFGDHTFVHVRVTARWTHAVKARFSADVDTLSQLHGGPFLVCSTPTNNKLNKFCAQFGFVPKLYLPADGNGEDKLILIRP